MKTKIRNELNRLASLVGGGPKHFSLNIQSGKLIAELSAIDQLACAVERFAYLTDTMGSVTTGRLRTIADGLSQKLSYLLEAINPIEVDPEACIVQMRSNPPAHDDDGTRYYELVVGRGELALCRYAKVPSHPRRIIPAHITHEVFERLAGDFAAAVE